MLDRVQKNSILVFLPSTLVFAIGMIGLSYSGSVPGNSLPLWLAFSIALAIPMIVLHIDLAKTAFHLIIACTLAWVVYLITHDGFGLNNLVARGISMLTIIAYFNLRSEITIPWTVTLKADVIIDRPRNHVWQIIHPKPTNNHWQPHIDYVESIPDQPEYLVRHFKPFAGTDFAPVFIMRVSEVIPLKQFVAENIDVDDDGVIDEDALVDVSRLTFEDAGNSTRVRLHESMRNWPFHMLLDAVLKNTSQDHLAQMKAILESQPDNSSVRALQKKVYGDRA